MIKCDRGRKVDALKVFVSVVEKKNFSRAAEEHHLSQPGVSIIIRNLEEEYQTQLLHRSPKRVELTRAGEILYSHAQEILRHCKEAQDEIHLLKNVVAGSIKIGASFTIGEYLVPGILSKFAGKYPQVDLQVFIGNTEEVEELIRSNQIDLGLVEGEVHHQELEKVPFMEDEMIVIMPGQHPFATQRDLTVEKMKDLVWILRERGSGTRDYGDHFIEEYDLKPRRIYEFSSNQGVKEAVAAGLGFSVISRLAVRKELKSGELASLPVVGGKHTRLLHCLHLKEQEFNSSRAMEAFKVEVRNYIKDLPK